MSIYDRLQPPQEGEYPEWFKFNNSGDTIAGALVNARIADHPEFDPAPVLEVQTADGTVWSVLCSTNSLYRQVYATRPEVGGQVRITFQGFQGRAKVFQLDYQPPAGGAPVAATPPPAPQPAPAPTPTAPAAGFGDPNAGATPWAQPTAPAPAPAPAPPWGQG